MRNVVPRAGWVAGLTLGTAAVVLVQAGPTTPPFELKPRELETIAKMADVERMMDRRGQVAPDEDLREYVLSVGDALVPRDFVDPRLTIRFKVLRAADQNAFALPNGSIYVTLGLLAQFENEAQLAGVLAHEIAHVARYHYFLFDRDYRSTAVAVNLLGIGTAAVGGWGGLLANVGVESLLVGTLFGYSRELEEEADRIALVTAANRGYDPGQIPALFTRLLIDYDGTHLEGSLFYSDHPKLQTRIAYTTRLIDETGMAVDPAMAHAERYRPFRWRAVRDAARLAIRDDLPRTAIAWAAAMIRQEPHAAEPHYLKAEAHRALGFRTQDLLTHPPSNDEKKAQAKARQKKTPAEIEAALAATPQGRAEWQKNSDAALAEYRAAIALDPSYPASYAGLAQLQGRLGRFDEAIAAAETFLELAAPADLERARLRRLLNEWKTRRPVTPGSTASADPGTAPARRDRP